MLRHFTALTALAFLSAGCIQLDLRLLVKKNGSGFLTEKVLFDTELLEELLGGLPAQAKTGPKPWELNEAELKGNATERGAGVTYVSGKGVETGKWKGYEAKYAFKNVQNVRVDPNPGKRGPKGPGQPPGNESKPMRFKFNKGATSKLTVLLPHEDKPKKDVKQLDPNDPSFEMMRGMLKDMSVRILVEVEGKVTKSTASHRDGNRVTMLALDFNNLINNSRKLAEVLNAQTFQASAKAFNSVKGMKIETKERVSVSFR